MIEVLKDPFFDERELGHIAAQFTIMQGRPFPEDDIVRWPNLLRMMPNFMDLASNPKTLKKMTSLVGPNLATTTLSEYAFVRSRSHVCVFTPHELKARVCRELQDLNLVTLLVAVTPLSLQFQSAAQKTINMAPGEALIYNRPEDIGILPGSPGLDKQFVEFSFFNASSRNTSQNEIRLLNELNISRVLLCGQNSGEICNYSIVWPGKTE